MGFLENPLSHSRLVPKSRFSPSSNLTFLFFSFEERKEKRKEKSGTNHPFSFHVGSSTCSFLLIKRRRRRREKIEWERILKRVEKLILRKLTGADLKNEKKDLFWWVKWKKSEWLRRRKCCLRNFERGAVASKPNHFFHFDLIWCTRLGFYSLCSSFFYFSQWKMKKNNWVVFPEWLKKNWLVFKSRE